MKRLTAKLSLLQIILLFSGTAFAWSNNLIQFKKFYKLEGTIFKFKNTITTNPFLTPCVWGATAFLVALFWAIYIYTLKKKEKRLAHQVKLMWLLVASNIFGWGVVIYEFCLFFKRKMQPFTSCTGLVQNPFQTACFTGSIIFLLSLVTTYFLVRNLKKGS